MPRSLKYEIPGPDWRRDCLDLTAGPIEGLFAPSLTPPFPVVVEIGFGRGEFLLDLARKSPDVAFLGVEVSFKRVLKMARKLAVSGLENVRIVEARGERVVGEFLPPASISELWLNFSDPWPKDRHARRRVVQPTFVRDVGRLLVPGGVFHVATDDISYAKQIDEVLQGDATLENCFAPESYRSEVPGRRHTGYESDWREQGRALHFFEYRRPESNVARAGACA